MKESTPFFRPVGELAQRELVTCDAQQTVVEVARLMHEHGISGVVVWDAGRPEGIVTDRDLRGKVLAQGRDPARTRAAEIMSAPLATIAADRPLHEALLRMRRQGIHRLVLTDADGVPAGIVTATDLLWLQAHSALGLVLDIEQARAQQFAHLNDRFALLVLGGKGRCEQSLATDQDNAIVHADDLPADDVEALERFSRAVIDARARPSIASRAASDDDTKYTAARRRRPDRQNPDGQRSAINACSRWTSVLQRAMNSCNDRLGWNWTRFIAMAHLQCGCVRFWPPESHQAGKGVLVAPCRLARRAWSCAMRCRPRPSRARSTPCVASRRGRATASVR